MLHCNPPVIFCFLPSHFSQFPLYCLTKACFALKVATQSTNLGLRGYLDNNAFVDVFMNIYHWLLNSTVEVLLMQIAPIS